MKKILSIDYYDHSSFFHPNWAWGMKTDLYSKNTAFKYIVVAFSSQLKVSSLLLETHDCIYLCMRME